MGGAPSDRRRWVRYQPIEPRAYVGWWQAGTYQTATARLICVGRGGVLLDADALPAAEAPVWACVAATAGGGWIEAAMRPAALRFRAPHRLRLIFRDPSSTSPFVSAAAPYADRPAAEPAPDEFRLLGLDGPCTAAEVRTAYRRAALRCHPDCGGTEQQFIRLSAAYAAALARCKRHGAGHPAGAGP